MIIVMRLLLFSFLLTLSVCNVIPEHYLVTMRDGVKLSCHVWHCSPDKAPRRSF